MCKQTDDFLADWKEIADICQCRTEDVPNGTLKVYQSGLNKRAVEALDSSLFNPYFNVRQNWGDGRSAA